MLSIALLAGVGASEMPDMTAITQALKSGDAKSLSSFFDENVEIAVMDDEDVYAKEDASEIIASFFETNKPKSFNQIHKGTSRGADSHYVIGDLVAGGKTYRVYIYMKEHDGAYKIHELRIEE